jgi:hypothetical protein
MCRQPWEFPKERRTLLMCVLWSRQSYPKTMIATSSPPYMLENAIDLTVCFAVLFVVQKYDLTFPCQCFWRRFKTIRLHKQTRTIIKCSEIPERHDCERYWYLDTLPAFHAFSWASNGSKPSLRKLAHPENRHSESVAWHNHGSSRAWLGYLTLW